MSNKEKFITIEGVDGAGKSSIISSIHNFLESRGEQVVLTREPGGTGLGDRLRELLLHHKMDLLSETLLMFASRAEHVQEVIRPALKEGKWVICDRFTDSTLAYQSAGKGLPESKIKTLQTLVQEDLRPSLTFMLDVPLHISKERLAKTNKNLDKFERESDDFFQRVIQGYKNIAKQDPNRCKLIDASGTQKDTVDSVLFNLEQFYQQIQNSAPKKMKM